MDFGNDSVDPYNPMVVDASDHAGEYIALNPNSWRVGNAEIPGSIPMEQNGDDNMSVDMLNNGETNMNLPEAPTILEFLNFPEMYRPQESFIRDFIEVSEQHCAMTIILFYLSIAFPHLCLLFNLH